MGSLEALQAIESRFTGAWTHTPFVFGNKSYDPNINQDWVRLTVLDGDGFQISLGVNSLDRHAGVVSIQIFTVVNQGEERSRWLVDKATEIFRKVSFSGLLFRVPNVDRVGADGTWFQMNVDCPFQRDELTSSGN